MTGLVTGRTPRPRPVKTGAGYVKGVRDISATDVVDAAGMTEFESERPFDRHPNEGLPTRERVGYLIYSFDARTVGDRSRAQYLELADEIIEEIKRG